MNKDDFTDSIEQIWGENKQTFIGYVPYVLIGFSLFLTGNRLTSLFIEKQGTGITDNILNNFFDATTEWLPSFLPTRRFIAIDFGPWPLVMGALTLILALYVSTMQFKMRRNTREGEEHGSARYGNIQKEGGGLKDTENEDNNVLYSENLEISMDTRKTFLNNNTLTIGGSGSGKTRFHVKPNLLNLACNYVVTDPKDTMVGQIGNVFYKNGYDMKYLNLVNFDKSMKYNPLKYIEKPKDVIEFVNNLVAGTTRNQKAAGGDEFFDKAEIALLTAIIFFIFATTETRPQDRTMSQVMDLLDMAEASEDDENMQSDLDFAFEVLEEDYEMLKEVDKMTERDFKNGWPFLAIRQYNLYKKAAGKTAKSILISVGVRMAVFNLPEIGSLLEYDELDLETIGKPKPLPKYDEDHNPVVIGGEYVYLSKSGEDCFKRYNSTTKTDYFVDRNGNTVDVQLQKTVLFVAISDSDSTFNFLATIIYQQLFNLLYRQADSTPEGRLPIHTRFVLDEFANTGKITDFEIKIATMRSREISADIILQNLAQLKNLFKESWETIEGNCDTTLFLGGKEQSTLERLSKIIGNATINYLNINENRGGNNSGTYSRSTQLISRPLLAPDEISRLPTSECLVHVRGHHIFRDNKIKLEKHKRYQDTGDCDKKLMFNTSLFRKKFLNAKNVIYPEDVEQELIIKNTIRDIGNLEIPLTPIVTYDEVIDPV